MLERSLWPAAVLFRDVEGCAQPSNFHAIATVVRERSSCQPVVTGSAMTSGVHRRTCRVGINSFDDLMKQKEQLGTLQAPQELTRPLSPRVSGQDFFQNLLT